MIELKKLSNLDMHIDILLHMFFQSRMYYMPNEIFFDGRGYVFKKVAQNSLEACYSLLKLSSFDINEKMEKFFGKEGLEFLNERNNRLSEKESENKTRPLHKTKKKTRRSKKKDL